MNYCNFKYFIFHYVSENELNYITNNSYIEHRLCRRTCSTLLKPINIHKYNIILQ